MKGFCSGFLALLPLGYFEFKSNQPSGVEVKQLLETAKICVSNPAGPFFAFSDYRPSVYFCRLISRSSMLPLYTKLLQPPCLRRQCPGVQFSWDLLFLANKNFWSIVCLFPEKGLFIENLASV